MKRFWRNLGNEDFKEIMGAISVIVGFLYIFCITFIEMSEDNQRFADICLGMIGTVVFGRVFEYYFGKDNGSDKNPKEGEVKDEID